MKQFALLLLLFPLIALSQSVAIIPLPAEVKPMQGSFNYTNGVSIKVAEGDNESIAISSHLATTLFNYGVKILPLNAQGKIILLRLDPGNRPDVSESYQVTVLSDT